MKELENSFCPKDRADWRNWLAKNHVDKEFIWLVYYKKSTGKRGIDYSDIVDEALCFGWIDSKAKSIDSERAMIYVCKRKPKSVWSKVNKEKVEKLICEDLFTEAGYKTIEVAKANGSWTILDEVEALIIPEDLKKSLDKNSNAKLYFESLSRSDKRNILQWLVLAKKAETRAARIEEVVRLPNEGKKPKQFGG